MPTILQIDDNPNILAYCAGRLLAAGYRVLAAREFEQARSILADLEVDLVVADLRFPGNGHEMLKVLRAREPRPPVVLFSVDVDFARRMAVDDDVVAVEKSPDLTYLLLAIDTLLRRRSGPEHRQDP